MNNYSVKRIKNSVLVRIIILLSMSFVGCKDQSERVDITLPNTNRQASVTMYSPTKGGKSTELMLYGANFGTDINNIAVYVNDVPAEVRSSTGNLIRAIVKNGSGSGKVKVVISSGNGIKELVYGMDFNYVSLPTVATAIGPSGEGNSIQGKFNGDYSTSTFSKPGYLAFYGNSLFIVEEKTDGSGAYTYAPSIRKAENNALSTILDYNIAQKMIDRPRAVAFSLDGNTMYIANDKNAVGVISFGKMTKGGSGFASPTNIWDTESVTALAVHPISGDVFFSGHSDNSWIYKYSSSSGQVIKKAQLTATKNGVVVKKPNVSSIVFSKTDNTFYVIAQGKHIIFKGRYDVETDAFSDIHILAGKEETSGYMDGIGTEARFNQPWQGDIGPDGNLYVADRSNKRIRRVTPDGEVTTYAGTGATGQKDGLLNESTFNFPQGLAFASDGTMYIADYWNHRIRKIFQD